MPLRWSRALAGICALAVCLIGLAACSIDPALTVALPSPTPSPIVADPPRFLTDPFLQFPTANSVRVVWFSEFDGRDPVVIVGRPGERDINPGTQQRTAATSSILSRTREDRDSHANGQKPPRSILYPRPQRRPIWRYEATVTGLAPGERVPYRVEMVSERGESLASDTFSLAPTPPPAQPLKILLTSDHQLKPMTAANLQ
ncbi:MAG: hypothetical protein AAF704_02575, partial [Cyanobacteria bacterium P01_D01_bin.123]